MGNKPPFPEPINTFLGILTAAIAVISTITGFILLWQGNKTVVTSVAISIGLISLWIFFLRIRLSRKRSTEKQFKHKVKGGYVFSARKRKWAEIGIIIIPVLAIGYISLNNGDVKEPNHSIVIVVAKFDGPENYGVNNFIVDKLRETIKEYKDLDLEVITTDEIITAQQGSEYAQSLGKKLNARTVIWGWFTASDESVYVTTHIDMIDVPYVYGSEESVGNIEESGNLIAPSAETSSFELQTELSENISASALFATGLILYSENKREDAVKLYSGALNLFPPDSNEEKFVFSRAEILSNRGVALAWLGRYDEAIKDANESLALDPNDFAYYHNRGLIYMLSNEHDLALEDFIMASKSPDKENSAISKFQIGTIYYAKKDYSKSLEYYSEVSKVIPDFYMVYFQTGMTYLDMGEKELARENFLKAKQLVNDKRWDSQIDFFIRLTY